MKKLLNDFESIETIKDLNRRGLSHSDYNTLYEVIKELHEKGQSQFIQQSIKNYLTKFNIKTQADGVGYVATI
jgi:hypothetical protein